MGMADLKTLVVFAHKSQGLSGYSGHTASKQKAQDWLETNDVDFVQLLDDHPPRQLLADQPELMALTDNSDTSTPLRLPKTSFKNIDTSDLYPLHPPGSHKLTELLDPTSSAANEMIGHFILYRWPPRMGGWMQGDIKAINTDAANKVKGQMCNFEVFYEEDGESAFHLLTSAEYALNEKAKIDSWVLLG